jgi:uncharacterized protein YggE
MEVRTGTRGGAGEHAGGESRSAGTVKHKTLIFAGLALALVAVPLALAGCGGDISSPAATAAVLSAAGAANTVTVSGQATVTSPPDEAVVVLTVENDAATAPAAMDATSIQTKNMLDRLKSDGIPESAIQTANITLYPVRTYDPTTGKETLTGYRAQNSIKVTLKDAPTVAKVLAAGVETGATQVSGPQWRLRDDSQAVNDALKQAAVNARTKAESLAAAEGKGVGEVLIMTEGTVQVPVPPMYSMGGATDSAKVEEPPVSSGNLDVTATVTVTYALKR